MPRRIGLAVSTELRGSENGESPRNDGEQSATAVNEALSRRSSGRIRHEEKITVYVSAEELLALEQARLTLRARHGVAVDRGRIVREALAVMLADLETSGEDSELVRRLSVP
jgi:hypothetical protein